MPKTVLITGASSGIGEAVARQMAAMGFTTYAAARRMDRMAHLEHFGVNVLRMDVTDPNSLRVTLKTIKDRSGGVDILINNAGYGAYGAFEEVPLAEARHQLDVNLFGLAELTQLVIPHMREQRWGKIINISSVAGVRTAPYGSWYHASKFAVEGLSASLRQELRPFGIDVVLIRPGAIQTEWAEHADQSLQKTSSHGPYAAGVEALHKALAGRLAKTAADPAVVAEAVQKALVADRPRSSYTVPFAAQAMLDILLMAGYDRVRDTLTRWALGLPKTM